MLDPALGKLVLRRLSLDSGACLEALASGAVKLADLDRNNEAHQEGVAAWIESIPAEKLTPIPSVWLSVLPTRCVMTLAPVMPEAKARVAKEIKNGNVNIEKLKWPESVFPKTWAEAIEKFLMECPNWDTFHAVQDRLPADIAANLRKELAVQFAEQERKKKEAKREARKNSTPKVDALAESIRKRDVTRLSKLKLEELSQVRWEAYKEEWLKAPAEILSYAAKVPVEFSRPYEGKILEACAECNWDIFPTWTITKSLLQQLTVAQQVRFVRDMVRGQLLDTFIPTVEPALTKEEIGNLLLADALQSSDNERLTRWFRGLEIAQYLRSLKTKGAVLSEEEAAQFKLALPSSERSYYAPIEDWLAGETEDDAEEVELILALLAWVKAQPEHKHPAYAARIAKSDEIREMFQVALTKPLFK